MGHTDPRFQRRLLYFLVLPNVITSSVMSAWVPPGQPGFLQVSPVPPGQPGFLQVSTGSSRSAWVPPGQPGFLQVSPCSSRSAWVPSGQPGWAGTKSVENTHHPLTPLSSWQSDCLPLISFLHFYGLVCQMYANANISSHCQQPTSLVRLTSASIATVNSVYLLNSQF